MEKESEILESEESDNITKSEIKFKQRKKLLVIDSDESENEDVSQLLNIAKSDNTLNKTDNLTQTGTQLGGSNSVSTENVPSPVKSKKSTAFDNDEFDSDIEENSDKCENVEENMDPLINLESVNHVIEDNNVAEKEESESVKTDTVYVTNKKGRLIAEDFTSFEETKKKLTSLCDTDSSEDESRVEIEQEETDFDARNTLKSSKKTGPKKGAKVPKEKIKKMTGKEALEQRKEIFSESQKRFRQKNVSIPYHKPKFRSLTEFLERKPKISSTVPTVNIPPAVAIKLATQQLKAITEKIKEHEKVVQVFYKSESESEDDENRQEEKNSDVAKQALEDKNSPLDITTEVSEDNNQKSDETKEASEDNQKTDETKEAFEDNNQMADKTEEALEDNQKSDETKEAFEDNNHDKDKKFEEKEGKIDEDGEENSENENIKENKQPSPDMEVEEINTNFSKEKEDVFIETNSENVKSFIEKENDLPLPLAEEQAAKDTDLMTKNTPKNHSFSPEKSNLEKDNKNEHNSNVVRMEVDEANNSEPNNTSENCSSEEPLIEKSSDILDHPEVEPNEENTSKSDHIEENTSKSDHIEENTFDKENTVDLEYDFNLDDVEIDNTEEMVARDPTSTADEERILNNIIQNFENAEKQLDDEERPKEVINQPTKLQLLKEKLRSFKPKLSGNPEEIIIFDEETPTPSAITKLKGRFFNHSLAKKALKHEVHTEIVCFTQGKLQKETVMMSVDVDEEPVAVMETPGAKLKKLREQLQSKIVQNRTEKYQVKPKDPTATENEDNLKNEEKLSKDLDDEILDKEEEMSTDSSESSEEEIEDLEGIKEKKRKKCDFIQAEAEESEEEEGGGDDDESESEREEDEEIEENNDENDQNNEENNRNNEENGSQKKKLKRIVKAFADDDSDEENENKNPKDFNPELDSTQSCEDDDVLPAYQNTVTKTPVRPSAESKNDFDFLTPVTFLTGLQSYSASKFLRDSPKETASPVSNSSQFKENDLEISSQEDNLDRNNSFVEGPQRKLVFPSASGTISSELFSQNSNTQSDIDSIALLCSGSFFTQPSTTLKDNEDISDPNTKSSAVEESVNEVPKKTEEKIESFPCISNEKAVVEFPIERNVEKIVFDKADKEVKHLTNSDYENTIISQLLDEEELEVFKKKFQSPVNNNNLSSGETIKEKHELENNIEDVKVKGGRLILDSSDEDQDGTEEENLAVGKNKKKITRKKITFSDDDSSDSEEEEIEEEKKIDLHDQIDEDEEEDVGGGNKRVVNYDSEENEMEDEEENEDEENKGKPTIKTTDFFENEAELSESDWGSEDEVENEDLDKLEFEEGDNEMFDEVKMRRKLEKIHMRQVLDKDNREIKLLQELLLEDGELHGSGRKRQFRWKDIDLFGNDEAGKENEDGTINEDEVDSEEKWRKMRYYRELYLKEKMEKSKGEESDLPVSCENSQIIQLGLKSFERSQNNSQSIQNLPKNSDVLGKPVSIIKQRGSFLARTDILLTKMAEMTKVPTNPFIGGAKNSKNFVFHKVTEVTNRTSFSMKRKITPEPPSALKKIKLATMTAFYSEQP